MSKVQSKKQLRSTLWWVLKLRCLYCLCQNHRQWRLSFSFSVANGALGSRSEGPGSSGRRRGSVYIVTGRRISCFSVSSWVCQGQVAAVCCPGDEQCRLDQSQPPPPGNQHPRARGRRRLPLCSVRGVWSYCPLERCCPMWLHIKRPSPLMSPLLGCETEDG